MGVNWNKMPPSGRLNMLLRSENELRAAAGFNIIEAFGIRQYGRIFLLAFGSLEFRVLESRTDILGLDRWMWKRFKGRGDM